MCLDGIQLAGVIFGSALATIAALAAIIGGVIFVRLSQNYGFNWELMPRVRTGEKQEGFKFSWGTIKNVAIAIAIVIIVVLLLQGGRVDYGSDIRIGNSTASSIPTE